MTTAADLDVVSSRLDQLLATGGLRSVLQPVVDLDTGSVVAHEALLRGPRDSGWETPDAVLAAARSAGRVEELDLVSLRSGIEHLRDRSPGGPSTLFLNLEPVTLTHHLERLLAVLDERPHGLQVVVELTERALTADPAAVVAGAEQLREAGCAIALDDIGASPDSLAFIPVLRPEVVKLDMRLLRTSHDLDTITVANSVRTYAESSGAEVVAEGVETEEDRTRALVLGATLGQGWYFGRPDPEPRATGPAIHRFRPGPLGHALRGTPFERLGPVARFQTAPKHLLLPVTRTLELTAMQSRVPPILLSCFQRHAQLTPRTVAAYAELGARLPFVAAFGTDMPAVPAPGVRGVHLDPTDPLVHEWTVVVLGAHESVALVARDLGDLDVPDAERRFEFTVTHDPVNVAAVAHTLIGRMTRD
ncbi:EAL domain-containing protein [Actinotalea sp.]|uniref:sensor domain-containing phosphodiesterase n=1 Tax=Actinotalea sp. TaxID=1872145 RepID=UPI002CC78882|nr:EAL domain-containing protein [Actinotalea sp.]HRA50074.1 EAL domain-containing protein [Actinotalea sp.]